MTVLDPPMERRLSGIESDIRDIKSDMATMKTDLAVIKSALPPRWLQFVFAVTILVPIYGILVALLVQVLRGSG